ncbi:MAG: hypothetical protein HY659_13040 [Rhizobiales bacterium]|nr:hypothetical protein [Hyphomicrobiales bacterium]
MPGDMMKKPKTKPNKSAVAKRQAGARREATKSAASQAPAAGDDAPDDMDAFRDMLLRRIQTLTGKPRRCRELVCRRAKRCVGVDVRCFRDFPARPVSSEQAAHRMAALRRALERRLAEFREEG